MRKTIEFGAVADLYDIYVRWDEDVPFFREICAGVQGEVLELMCGTGRLSMPLLQAGTRLCCVDYSAEMLEVFRRKLRQQGLTAEVQEADVRELDLGRSFELVLLPFHSFADVADPEDRARALARIRGHLSPGGRFVIALHNAPIQVSRLDGVRRMLCDRPFPDREATLRVWIKGSHVPGSGVGEGLQEYEILDRDGGLLESRELPMRFAVTDRATFEREAAAAGFRVLRLWGDYAGGPFETETSPYMIWELGSQE
jgi:SAM-dependent methyltransferase